MGSIGLRPSLTEQETAAVSAVPCTLPVTAVRGFKLKVILFWCCSLRPIGLKRKYFVVACVRIITSCTHARR